jgi:hypothetical protein
VNRRSSRRLSACWLLGAFAVGFGPSCTSDPPPPDAGRFLTDPRAARDALEKSLNAWRESPDVERTANAVKPIMFVEQQQPAGQRLTGFEVLGETAGYEGYRRFLARLSLEDPEEAITAAYYVFGQGPIWVYRAEDFDMIMHMDKSMMPPPPDPAAPPPPEPAPSSSGTAPDPSRQGGGTPSRDESLKAP